MRQFKGPMITRRQVLAGAASLVITARIAAQPRIRRVGIITYTALTPDSPYLQAFYAGLGERGWREGQNLIVERRAIQGRPDQIPALAMELINLGVEVIALPGDLAAKAVKAASPAITIVMIFSFDPVGHGLAASLARPGGSVTGLTFNTGPAQALKDLQLFKEALPSLSRLALIWDPTNLGHAAYARRVVAASKDLGIEIASMEVRDSSDVTRALESIRKDRPGAFWMWDSPAMNPQRAQMIEFGMKERLPALGVTGIDVERGCLMAYSTNLLDLFRRAGGFVDRILRGTKPGDLPIEQPTKFELTVNLRTAKALGLTIPQLILLRADRLIE